MSAGIGKPLLGQGVDLILGAVAALIVMLMLAPIGAYIFRGADNDSYLLLIEAGRQEPVTLAAVSLDGFFRLSFFVTLAVFLAAIILIQMRIIRRLR